MTDESPLVICHRCQTPVPETPPNRIRGEYYCRECTPAVVSQS